MNTLPCPDFDNLPLDDYDGREEAGRICLTYETSRGCYWSKCAYCVDLPLPRPSYRRKDPRLVVEDMRELQDKYKCDYLLMGDPGMSPRQMREISQEKLRQGVDIGWWTMARLDPGFDRKLFDLAARGGLRQVNFGFESADDRVCGLLDKGNLRRHSSRIIKDCALAGIRVDLQTMLGLPGETFEDGLDTVEFLASHREFIYDVTFNTYYLTPSNKIFLDPEKYGIEYDKDGLSPFAFFIPFRNKNGMDRPQAELLEKIYHSFAKRPPRERSGPASYVEGKPGGKPGGKLGTDTIFQEIPPGKIVSVPNFHEGELEFRLNGESCKLRYRRIANTEEYTFYDSP